MFRRWHLGRDLCNRLEYTDPPGVDTARFCRGSGGLSYGLGDTGLAPGCPCGRLRSALMEHCRVVARATGLPSSSRPGLSYLHTPHAKEPANVVHAREHGEEHGGSQRRPDNVLHWWASFLSTGRQQFPPRPWGTHSLALRHACQLLWLLTPCILA